MEFKTETNINTCTELRLGLPGSSDEYPSPSTSSKSSNKRGFYEEDEETAAPPPKAQIVGWPPVRAYRKNNAKKPADSTTYVKVSMDGAPYLRKIDLKMYESYQELLKSLEDMFKIDVGKYTQNRGSEFVPTYEDKDGDWMLVGDVPWYMFISSCKKLRIMKGSAESRGFITCL